MRTDPEALTVARKAAVPGERVLWAGRTSGLRWPSHPVMHSGGMLIAVAGGTAWALGTGYGVPRPAILMVLAVPVLVFAGLFALALWQDMRMAVKVQAVTDRRVMLIDRKGAVRAWVGLDRASEFRLVGRTLHLGGEQAAIDEGRTDLDGGLARFDALPKLEGLAEPEGVLALIRKTAGAA
ncbi:MAG: hypothetical protein IBJ02_07660 [Brevundimonas sp.]|nr:hypothetical protein [Brevundimonas sp.]